MARTAAETEIAINRLTKLRFPQGSEVSTSGCPKFGAIGKSGLTNPVKAKTVQPGLPPWRAAFASPRNWSRALSSERRLAGDIDRLLSTSPFGFIVFFLLGFVAGLINLVRTAGVMSRNR